MAGSVPDRGVIKEFVVEFFNEVYHLLSSPLKWTRTALVVISYCKHSLDGFDMTYILYITSLKTVFTIVFFFDFAIHTEI